MGRKKIQREKKKTKLSITVSEENFKNLEESNANRSKLINLLLQQHFGLIDVDSN